MLSISSLNHTPGVVYAIAYWFTTMMYIRLWGLKKEGTGQHLRDAAFLILLTGFMYVTDGVSRIFFILSVLFIGLIMVVYIYLSTELIFWGKCLLLSPGRCTSIWSSVWESRIRFSP